MDIIKLYQDYSIPIADENDRHYQPGWVNTPCPFCTGNPGNHLGYNIDENYFHCWRCGGHFADTTISKLVGCNLSVAKRIIKLYKGDVYARPKPEVKVRIKSFKPPSDLIPLTDKHKHYLEGRGFNTDWLEQEYKICSTGPLSRLDDIDFKHRIFIPILWPVAHIVEQVSFQTRSTGNEKLKYITCPKERELIHHKNIIYTRWFNWTDTGICVEGVTDVWRFGISSFATFGIQYTYAQLKLIARTFKRVAVMFDDDPQAVKQANKLVDELKFRQVDAFRVPIQGDPASLSQKEADYLVKQIIL